MSQFKFTKMNGLGNDFVIFNFFSEQDGDKQISEIIKYGPLICDRKFGIGCDQLLIIAKSDIADIKVIILNQDGSSAGACGNGMRAVASLINRENLVIEVGDNLLSALRLANGDFSIKMSAIRYIEQLEYHGYQFHRLDVGNPHIVTFDSIDSFQIKQDIGRSAQIDFKTGMNVSFVKIKSRKLVEALVYERGCGFTMACGSAAVCIFKALLRLGLVENSLEVEFEHGALHLYLDEDGEIWQSGKADCNFEGVIDLQIKR